MPTITFKVTPGEAARIKRLAVRAGCTVSEFLRRRAMETPEHRELSSVALAHAAHTQHDRTEEWVASLTRADRLATSSITELGFIRVAPQARLSPDVRTARDLLSRLRAAARPKFIRLADDLGADALPAWVTLPAQTTDGHLVALAAARNARLATLDESIPAAFQIPH